MYRWASVLVVLLAVLATVLWSLGRGGSGGEGAGGARVLDREGLTIVRVSGSPKEKGRALGTALREKIKGELARALPAEEGVREFAVKTCGERLAPFLPPALREEIEGLAEGAGISFHDALFLDTRYEIAAFGLAPMSDLPSEGAAGPGPEAACLLPRDAAEGLVVIIHEDEDPPLVLVSRPGMAGGFLGIKGDVAAAMRPIPSDVPPPLHGLIWTLLFRRLLEKGPDALPPEDTTGPLSVALALPGGRAATLNLSVAGAAIRDAAGGRSVTTDEPVAAGPAGKLPRLQRDPAKETRFAEDAERVLTGPPPPGAVRVSLVGGASGILAVEGAEGKRTISLTAR